MVADAPGPAPGPTDLYPGRVSTVYDLTREQLAERLTSWGEPAFRAKQVWRQLWQRAATYEQMSDVSPALRDRLAEELPIGVEVLDDRTADRGATRKALLRLGGKHAIEVVLMGYRDWATACISSQAGCAMGLHVLRDRPDGADEQPHGRRDRRPGRVGASGGREASRLDPSAPHEHRVHGDGGADERVLTTQPRARPQRGARYR
jgi:hypothetical protein